MAESGKLLFAEMFSVEMTICTQSANRSSRVAEGFNPLQTRDTSLLTEFREFFSEALFSS